MKSEAKLKKKVDFLTLHAALFDTSSCFAHTEIIKNVNGGRWFVFAVRGGMRWQGMLLINFRLVQMEDRRVG